MTTRIAIIMTCMLVIAAELVYGGMIKDARATLTFSNTQTWAPEIVYLAQNTTPRTAYYVEQITLPPPPSNLSTTTAAEISYLHQLAIERNSQTQAAILYELSFNNFTFGSYVTGTTTMPHTSALIKTAHKELIPIIFSMKERFDRVRPNYLDPTLTTAITVPEHPAYPSGHATEAHLVAEILSRLNPENATVYFADAARIAHNREIAGVHYPSDSTAGRLLAAQFASLYFESEEGRALLAHAQSEWSDCGQGCE